jgi:glycerol-3-phosphate acyltransferase PlsY
MTADIIVLYVFVILAYLLGSIPASVWIGRKFYNKDVRKFGSGNAGATNTARVLGYKTGLLVLLFDIFKGWLPVYASIWWINWELSASLKEFIPVIVGAAATIGHILPIYLQFKGGKGVATIAGVVLAIFPKAFLTCLIIFTIVVLITRYVSLGSISVAISFPFLLFFVFQDQPLSLKILSIVGASILIYTHRKNIRNLLKGKEKKFKAKKIK